MKSSGSAPRCQPPSADFVTRAVRVACALFVLSCVGTSARGQSAARPKLPAADKIVNDYIKAVGGKKRLAGLRDAVYVWAVEADGHAVGSATTRVKAPGSSFVEIKLDRDVYASRPRRATPPSTRRSRSPEAKDRLARPILNNLCAFA